MQAPDQLVMYARQIAIYRAYPVLEQGLQPVEDYEHDGKIQPGLKSKLEHEHLEFSVAVARFDIWHQYHEAADLLYYASCIDYVACIDYHYYNQFEAIRAAGLKPKCAEKAALAKYAWRSERPGNKDEAYEIELIRNALCT